MGACSVYNVRLHASVDSSVAIASWPGRLSVCGGGCIKTSIGKKRVCLL